MQGAVRIGDLCSGHGCHPPRPVLDGSADVLVDGAGAVTVGSHWAQHRCGKNTHEGVSVQGSSTVFVNGKPKVRQGDAIDCGSVASGASSTVFVG